LKNIIAGIELALDKPFGIGDRVKIADWDGSIEGIGLRSTTLRTLTGYEVTIPNELAANTFIENIGRRPFIRRDFDIGLVFETRPGKVARATEILKEVLAVPEGLSRAENSQEETPTPAHPNEAINGPGRAPRVSFDSFNPDSLNIKVTYWHYPAEYTDYLAHAQLVNLQIMERFREEGIEMAFPTQTIFLAGDEDRSTSESQKSGG
jgi:MscS family membrane protein